MTQSIFLYRFNFNCTGLHFSYFANGVRNIVKLDPCATCDLLKSAGLIEDFTTDRNGEPVILFSDNNEPQGYGYELWFQFVESFPLSNRVIEILAEYREQSRRTKKQLATIIYLLSPLKAA
jgi:hypothetical protein